MSRISPPCYAGPDPVTQGMEDFAVSATGSLRRFALIFALALLPLASAMATKVETWRQDSAAAFARAKKERLVVSDLGRVSLGRKVSAVGDIDAAHVWKLARTRNKVLYAATGNAGKVYRREADGPWTLAYKSEDSQVLSLAATPDGRVFCGTGPSGAVVEITDPKTPISHPDPSVKYVWDLTADASGNLYAATGPTGQLWKRDPGGKWSLLLDSKHPHLLCVVAAPDGSVYAGSDGEGLIYKVAAGGRVSVLYDAPQNEIHALLLADDGSLFAGTSADASGGSGGPTLPRAFSAASLESAPGANGGVMVATLPMQAPIPRPRPGDASAPPNPPGGTASPRPVAPGENAVYRIGPDGAPREIFRACALIYTMAFAGKNLLVGTGPEGQIFEVRDLGGESAPIARLDQGQVLSMIAGEGGEVLIGTGDAGGVFRLDQGYVASGSITSEVHDAKLVSHFGAIVCRDDLPPKTSISVQLRTGNVGEPDSTWSEWRSPLAEMDGRRPAVPPGRFAQYRAILSSEDPAVSPALRSIAIHYQTGNLAPEIARIVVPDLTAADGVARQIRFALRWDVADPNDDELAFTLFVRKEGWPDWVKLTETPLTDRTYSWDTTAVPAGNYRLKLVASDRPSNPADTAMTRELASDSFVVDHQSPTVSVAAEDRVVKIVLKDDLTRLVKAAYALDGGEWQAIFPDDGLFDTNRETITLALPNLKPGTHVLTVRATDAAGNLGAGDVVFKSP